MLFSEIYSSYYNAVSKILAMAAEGTLTGKALSEAVKEKAFDESSLVIPAALKEERWRLLTKEYKTPLYEPPTMPLTTLQKQWLKALLLDPRIRLFAPGTAGLEDVEPLYMPEMLVYYDRHTDGDPFQDESYIRNFQTIISALKENRNLRIRYRGASGRERRCFCVPIRMEYSSLNDKFRLLAEERGSLLTLNLSRIQQSELGAVHGRRKEELPDYREEEAVLELTDERDAMRRAMIAFSDLEKETLRLDKTHYQIRLWYKREDETELLIRILSFGPMLRVMEPQVLADQIRARLRKQREYRI